MGVALYFLVLDKFLRMSSETCVSLAPACFRRDAALGAGVIPNSLGEFDYVSPVEEFDLNSRKSFVILPVSEVVRRGSSEGNEEGEASHGSECVSIRKVTVSLSLSTDVGVIVTAVPFRNRSRIGTCWSLFSRPFVESYSSRVTGRPHAVSSLYFEVLCSSSASSQARVLFPSGEDSLSELMEFALLVRGEIQVCRVSTGGGRKVHFQPEFEFPLDEAFGFRSDESVDEDLLGPLEVLLCVERMDVECATTKISGSSLLTIRYSAA